jgi:hypothetical protein
MILIESNDQTTCQVIPDSNNVAFSFSIGYAVIDDAAVHQNEAVCDEWRMVRCGLAPLRERFNNASVSGVLNSVVL